MFKLNETLSKDTIFIKEKERCLVLLSKTSVCPWLILVPKTNKTELYQMNVDFFDIINLYSKKLFDLRFDLTLYREDKFKLNIASFGNIVSQLHVHLILRHEDDKYFPDSLFGKVLDRYKKNELQKIQQILQIKL